MSVISNPYSDGQILTAGSMFKPVAFFNATSTIANSTSETEVYGTVIPANTVSHGMFVIAPCRTTINYAHSSDDNTQYQIKMGSPTPTQITTGNAHISGTIKSHHTSAVTLVCWETGQDWTNATSLVVTAKNSVANAEHHGACVGVIAMGI